MKPEHDRELKFGQYKGQLISQVMSINPGYLVWASDTISWFTVPDEVYEEALARKDASNIRRSYHRSFGSYTDNWEDSDADWEYQNACIGYEH